MIVASEVDATHVAHGEVQIGLQEADSCWQERENITNIVDMFTLSPEATLKICQDPHDNQWVEITVPVEPVSVGIRRFLYTLQLPNNAPGCTIALIGDYHDHSQRVVVVEPGDYSDLLLFDNLVSSQISRVVVN